MKQISQRINQTPLSHVLVLLLVFFLPFQERYSHLIKTLSKFAYKGQYFPSYFLGRSLEFYLSDLIMLSLLFLSGRLAFQKGQKFLVAFLGFSLLSIVFSSSSNALWPYYRWLQLALPILVCCTIAEHKNLLKASFWIVFFTSIFQSIVAIVQYVMQQSIGLKHLGEQHIAYLFSPEVPVLTKHRWIFDSLFNTHTLSQHILRPFGTLPHPNVLGAFIVIALIATLYLYLKTKRRILALAIPLQLFTLALSFSRGAIFGLIGALGVFFFLLVLSKKGWKQLIVPLAVGILICSLVLKEQYVYRGGVVNRAKSARVSDSMRMYYHSMAINMAKNKPLLGHGYGQYLIKAESFDPHTKPFEIQKVHNVYLLILAESGILALLAYLAYFGSLITQLFRRGIDLEGASIIAILAFILFSQAVDYFWLELQHGRLMLFLTCGLAHQVLRTQLDSSRQAHQEQAATYSLSY